MGVEHRRSTRARTFLSGTVTVKERHLVMTVDVKDLSSTGAKLRFGDTTPVPDTFELTIKGRKGRHTATCMWRTAELMGVALTPLEEDDEQLQRRMLKVERERKILQAKIERLSSGW